MNLYRTDAGDWVGTQDDARKLAGKAWGAVDVPTDKAGLLAFLNERLGRGSASQDADTRPTLAAPPVEDAPIVAPPPVALKTSTIARDISIEEAIGEADLPRTIRLSEHVFTRLKEHVRAAKELTE